MSKKLSYEEVRVVVENCGFELISEEYINNTQNLILEDKEGYYYTSRFNNLKIGKIPERFSVSNPYTIQNIKLWCRINKKPFELVSNEYIGSKEKLQWKCLKDDCGEIFENEWHDILAGQSCPFCLGRKIGLSNCLAINNPLLASQWHPTNNGDLTPYDVTYNYNKNVWWKCNKNPKHEWENSIRNRNNGDGCPYCSGRYSTEENNLLVNNSELCKEWDYNKNEKNPKDYTPFSNQHVWWKCKECGHEWNTLVRDRNKINGTGCPECSESHGEKRCKKFLNIYSFPHESQYKFDNLKGIGGGLLRFDESVFWDKEKTKLRLLIEYDGIFHYEKQYDDDGFERLKIHDRRKNNYCILHNIPLIRIPYWDFDDIETILNNILNKNNMNSKHIVNNLEIVAI